MDIDYIKDIVSEKTGEKYDVAVMYSGGKDSSYLLYLFSQVYKLKTIAVMVDNGYENDYLMQRVSDFPKTLGVPFKILTPGKDFFRPFFNMLVTENEFFAKPGVNHVCFICNNILWATACKFAAENGIPYVASGLSYAQLNSGRNTDLKINKVANAIAQRSTKFIFKNAISGIKQTEAYKNNKTMSEYIEKLNNGMANTTTIYPFIYLHLADNAIKEKIISLGWKPPKNVSADQYISSGCKILSNVVSEMEKLGMLSLNEREQAKRMVEEGLAGEEQLEFANHQAINDIVDLRSPILEELKVKDYLIEKCSGRDYKI